MFATSSLLNTLPTEVLPLSLHDALPILARRWWEIGIGPPPPAEPECRWRGQSQQQGTPPQNTFFSDQKKSIDRKSTRLNSSHLVISYAVFCLKKKIIIRYRYSK